MPVMHCSQKGPYFRDRVPIGTFLTFWVPIYIPGSLLSLFWLDSREENVNSVCMYTKMSKLDLCSLKPSLALGNALHIYRHWFCVTLLANFDSYLRSGDGFHKS